MKELLGSAVSLSVPARVDFVRVLRSVVGGVAARLDLSYDEIDDLRLAVDEACATLLGTGSRDGQLTLALTPDQDGLTMTAEVQGDGSGWPPDAEDSLAWQVLSALVDEASFEARDGTLTVRMRKARGERPDAG